MTKQRSNRLGMYEDVRTILDAALSAGGGTYQCDDHGAAIHWRQRAYKFRKLFAEVHGATRASKYDILVMPRIEGESADVVIQVRRQVGVFVPAEAPPADLILGDDDLLDIAAGLADKIDKGEV